MALSRLLYDALNDMRSATWLAPRGYDQLEDWGRTQLLSAMDLLIHYFESGDSRYLDLFSGFIRSHMIDGLYAEAIPADFSPGTTIALAEALWLAELNGDCGPLMLGSLSGALQTCAEKLNRPASKKLRVLFIGDCIVFEIQSLLVNACGGAGLAINSTILSDKIMSTIRNKIRKLDPAAFDLVFFSPFSHEFTIEYAQLLDPKNALRSARETKNLAAKLLQETCATIDTLAQHFDCAVYVHNSVGVTRSFNRFSRFFFGTSSAAGPAPSRAPF